MYSQKPIPSPFRRTSEQPQPVSKPSPDSPIEATEKTTDPSVPRQRGISPLAALLFLDFFSILPQKK